jgi:hypothetical protein
MSNLRFFYSINLYGENMPEFVTLNQDLGLVQPGGHLPIFIEQPTLLGNTLGHGAGQMTDSLAVYDLFIQLDASLRNGDPADTLAQLKPLFEAARQDAKLTTGPRDSGSVAESLDTCRRSSGGTRSLRPAKETVSRF